MKKHFLFAVLGIALIASCTKKDEPSPALDPTPPAAQESVHDYYPLAKGNYWVYQHTYFDSSGNLLPQSWKNDSVVVQDDTLINGITYHTVAEYNFLNQSSAITRYLRDSADCIVDNNGKLIFSIKQPGLILKDILTPDTVAYVNYYYAAGPASITTPLGTYNCTDLRGEMFRKVDNFSKTYYLDKYAAKNIGVVRKTSLFVGALYRINFDLVAYHI